ncbi:MAG: type IV pili methyl-accepting chemotaxis transducer N-terminal domain-containing protein, partial [Rhodoferax sp.]
MSVFDPLKNLFSRKVPEPERDSGLSLAMPDGSSDLAGLQTVQSGAGVAGGRAAAAADAPGGLAPGNADQIALAVLGSRSVAQHQRTLAFLFFVALLILAGLAVFSVARADRAAKQLGATGQALMQSQRLAKSVSLALQGNAAAFGDVAQSAEVLVKAVSGLQGGSAELEKALPLVARAEQNAKAVVAQQKVLTQVGATLRQINRQSSELLDTVQSVSNLKLQQGASAADLAALGQLLMLTQRIDRSSNEFLAVEGASANVATLLGKDLTAFKDIASALLHGAKDSATREQLTALDHVQLAEHEGGSLQEGHHLR